MRTNQLKSPAYAHCCKLYGENCRCHYFICSILVNRQYWDAWSVDYGASVLFRWGIDGSDYYAARISEFPLHSAKSADDRNLWTKKPNVSVLNKCWERVRNYFGDNPNQR